MNELSGMSYAGKTEVENKLRIVGFPSIPATQYRAEELDVAKRNGQVYSFDGTVEDIEIPIMLEFSDSERNWFSDYQNAKKWLLQRGENQLIFSENKNFFYKVKRVWFEDSTRISMETGQFTAVFLCEGYVYLLAGQDEHASADVKNNPYDLCEPIYKITGNGSCTLTVNGKIMKATVGQNLTIDTERMLAYRESDGKLLNTSVTGDYEDLYLKPGNNTISVTSGFTLKVIPNWRCL